MVGGEDGKEADFFRIRPSRLPSARRQPYAFHTSTVTASPLTLSASL
jgi:hypothetical protein